MSVIYTMIYIFIAIVVLLCLLSALMYFCHVCGDVCPKCPTLAVARRKSAYSTEQRQPLNKTEMSHILSMEEPHSSNAERQPQTVNVRSRVDSFNHHSHMENQVNFDTDVVKSQPANIAPKQASSHPSPVSSHQSPTSPNQSPIVSPLNAAIRALQRNHSDKRGVKPPVAVKPTIHSLPSSKRSSLIREPPATTVQSQPGSKRNSMVKPRAPPPPPPTTASAQPVIVPPLHPRHNTVSMSPIYDTPENYLNA